MEMGNRQSMKERRRTPRAATRARVCISHSVFGEVEGVTLDISDTGVLVQAEHLPSLPVGAHVTLQFLDSVNPELRFNAKAVRQTRWGTAFELVDYEFAGTRHSLDELRLQWARYAQYDRRG